MYKKGSILTRACLRFDSSKRWYMIGVKASAANQGTVFTHNTSLVLFQLAEQLVNGINTRPIYVNVFLF